MWRGLGFPIMADLATMPWANRAEPPCMCRQHFPLTCHNPTLSRLATWSVHFFISRWDPRCVWFVVSMELENILHSEKSRPELEQDPRLVLWKNQLRVGLSVGLLTAPFSCARGTQKNDPHVGFPTLHPIGWHVRLARKLCVYFCFSE